LRKDNPLRSPDNLAILAISMIFISGFIIYLANIPTTPKIRIYDVSFKLEAGRRLIEFYVEAVRGYVELKQLFINDEAIRNWYIDSRLIAEGSSARCVVEYPWRMGETYTIKLTTTDDLSVEVDASPPVIKPDLKLKLGNITIQYTSSSLKIGVGCLLESNGTTSLQPILFVYRAFNRSDRNIYVFYDRRFMAYESLRRAEAIARYLQSYNITVYMADYDMLRSLSILKPAIILVVVEPMKDGHGRVIHDALPAPLIDPNGNGYIRDDSLHGRSTLYDWMHDRGLILVTVGSITPYKRIVYIDGSYRYAIDSYSLFDVHEILTDASGSEPIVGGSMFIGDYTPTRISCTLGLHYRESSFALDRDSMDRYGLSYYAYGDYKLRSPSATLNLTLPVFVRVGRGGWIAVDSDGYWLTDGEIAHDIFMIYIHRVWDSKWIPYGWYWDSCTAFHRYNGSIRVEDILETEWIPLNVVGGSLAVRVLAVAYCEDLNIGLIREEILELRL